MSGNASPYFDRDGLLAADLTADVMHWVDCGYNVTTKQMFAYSDGVWRQGETAVEKASGLSARQPVSHGAQQHRS